MKTIEIEINNPTDLKNKMPCPKCKKELICPKYECHKCQIKLIYWVKKWQIKK